MSQQYQALPQTVPPGTPAPPAPVFVRCSLNGKVLDVSQSKGAAGAAVLLHTEKEPPVPTQLWHLENYAEGYFWVKSDQNPNLVLEVEGGAANPGARIVLGYKKGAPDKTQMFQWHQNSLKSALGQNLVLDMHGASHIVTWLHNGEASQCWVATKPYHK